MAEPTERDMELAEYFWDMPRRTFAGPKDVADAIAAHLAPERAEAARNKGAMLALESLTPNGSEYVGDIERCVQHVRGHHMRMHELVKTAIKARKLAEAEIARLTAEVERLRNALRGCMAEIRSPEFGALGYRRGADELAEAQAVLDEEATP